VTFTPWISLIGEGRSASPYLLKKKFGQKKQKCSQAESELKVKLNTFSLVLAFGIVMSISTFNANALTIYSQGISPIGTYGSTYETSLFSQRVADEFALASKTTIRSLSFMGVDDSVSPPTSEDFFRFNFYSRDGLSLPSSSAIVPGGSFKVGEAHQKTDSGLSTGQGLVYRYEVDLGAGLTLDAGEYWIEITNDVVNWGWARGINTGAVISSASLPTDLQWEIFTDNTDMSFSLYDNNLAVPEPTTYVLFVMGLLGLSQRQSGALAPPQRAA